MQLLDLQAAAVPVPSHVAELLSDDFSFERRGMVHVKGKGEMEYFLTGRKKPYMKSPASHFGLEDLAWSQRKSFGAYLLDEPMIPLMSWTENAFVWENSGR